MIASELVAGNSQLRPIRYDHYHGTMKSLPGAISPLIAVDRNATKPLYRQIYDACRAAIVARNLTSGQQVPSTRALAAELGISRIPVLDAYAQLLAEGYFESRAGAGTFVSSSLPTPAPPRPNERPRRSEPAVARPASRRSAPLPRREEEPWLYGSGPFTIGQLALDHFPSRTWAALLTRHARKVTAAAMNYGDPMGLLDLREAIAAYVRTARAVQCEARQVMVVGGSQQALLVCANVLLDYGDRAWIEEPGYTLMRSALTLAGVDPYPVPVDREGLDVAAGIRRCRRARAAWVTPSHQFPLGVTMSASRRLQLLEWARGASAWIVEDDYDSEYRYDSMPIASLQGLDGDARVVYVGTFSKTLFPSLRLGYVVIPPDLVSRFAAARRAIDLCPPYLHQAALAEFIRDGHFARHIRRTRLVYSKRRRALVEALENEFGKPEIIGAEAGLHLTLLLPDGHDDRRISARAAQRGLWLWPLSATYLGEPARQGLILGFGNTRTAEVAGAVRKLRAAIQSAS